MGLTPVHLVLFSQIEMDTSATLSAAVQRLLEPLVGILLQHGVPHAAFAEQAKQVYVDVAEAQGGVGGRKVSTSRVSVVTGLTRKDVARLRSVERPSGAEAATRYHRAARVVTAWIREPAYLDAEGEPRVLPMDGDAPSFRALVKSSAGDVPRRAVFDELERAGTVELTEAGEVRLLARAYLPRQSAVEQLEVLGTDVGGLIDSIAHNLDHTGDDLRFQRKVYYDNLPAEALPELQALTRRHGQELLERLDKYMAAHDRDANPEAGGTGRKRAGIGVFYFEDDHGSDLDDGESGS